jgi:CysZ protein
MSYFFAGFDLIKTKGLKRFVFVPLMINVLLFSIAFYFVIGQIQVGVDYILSFVPDFLGWLKDALIYILWPIAVLTVLLGFALIFGSLANWIAAPFNGLLSEKVERHLRQQDMGDEGLLSAVKDIPRTLSRELEKMLYFIPRAIGFLLLFFILPIIGQIIWFLFSAWMMAIQYCDYPYDNHKVPFKTMRRDLNYYKSKSFSFGITVNLFSLVPILNFLVMPVAICGATAMWVDELSEREQESCAN